MENTWNIWRQIRWKGSIACVFCGENRYRRHSMRRGGLYRYQCLNCRRIFSDTSGTFLESSKVPFEKWRIAATHYSQNRQISLRALQQILHLSYPTVSRIICLFRQAARNRELKITTENPSTETQATLITLLVDTKAFSWNTFIDTILDWWPSIKHLNLNLSKQGFLT